ncbi:hypothetical protein [Intestinibacter bartlettii]|uniref:hypothetical protein n=1 Tax=Intestinibacter bartlettii TaxID=261299 RepID=UPI003522B435
MNNLLLILGLLALSNGNVSLFGNKNKNVSNESLKIDKKDTKKLVQKTKKSSRDNENRNNKNNQSRKLSSSLNSNTKKIKKIKKIRKNSKHKNRKLDNPIQYNVDDIKAGIKLMDLSEEDLDRGMEIITRTKKYMSSEERKMLIKMESILDLVKGIKKLNDVDILEKEDESEFFRNMDEEDKKNMMIKEILEVFPEKRKESVEKAIDMKKKIDLFAELFLPEDGEGGFSLSSLADISNLGSSNNIKLLGSLLRGDNLESDEDNDEIEEYDEEYNEDDYQYGEYYEEYENGYNKNRYD